MLNRVQLNINMIFNYNSTVLYLKSPFNAYSFELVGDGLSTTFFQVSPGGSVTLRQSISSDPATSFQVGNLFEYFQVKDK